MIYRLLVDHYLPSGAYAQAGSTISAPVDIPFSWPPTQAVDPIDSDAITAFWNQGPVNQFGAEKTIDYGPFGYRPQWAGVPVAPPNIYWVAVPGPGSSPSPWFQLNGNPLNLGPKQPQ